MKKYLLICALLVAALLTSVQIRKVPPAQAADVPKAESFEPEPAGEESAEPAIKHPEPIVIVENGERISVPPKEVEPEAHLKQGDLDWEELPWEKPVDEILLSNQSNQQKIDALVKLLASTARPGQVEIMHEIVELSRGSTDELLTNLLFRQDLHETVTSVLLTELLKRSNDRRLPMLLSLAQVESHPNSGEAVELLQLLLEQDHAQDWSKWQTAINAAIQAPR
jgi:hypothetical protein